MKKIFLYLCSLLVISFGSWLVYNGFIYPVGAIETQIYPTAGVIFLGFGIIFASILLFKK